ncbi:MOSC domain-containing protein [Sphingopyxis sp. KK2]|uniref:MOSC domain-containing protein n=1 Tax=Sphingopyxis sp. KK2 TaxID=1855727 RepID=UPI00097E64E6|nr:MOSC domain-containing protein [Sphingopyxis sp. KK2]
MNGPPIVSLRVGPVQALGPKSVPSGIAKQEAGRPIFLSLGGFEGDEQGDTRYHGGCDKAVHHYPLDHYALWRAELGSHPLLDRPGAFGENISARGLLENHAAVGDRFRLGKAIVEVSQGRQPCFRLNLRMDIPDMARRMQQSGRTGWYYRVIEEGVVERGDTLELIDRLTPSWTIARLWRLLYIDTLDREGLSALAATAHLPLRWRELAAKRLRSGQIEDWSLRLGGS